jgi:hypothetical protein
VDAARFCGQFRRLLHFRGRRILKADKSSKHECGQNEQDKLGIVESAVARHMPIIVKAG